MAFLSSVNFLQVDNSVLLQSCSTRQAGLETQRSVGSGCHPQTIRRVRRRLVADFGKSLSQVIKMASDQGQQIVLVIDDFHIMKDAHRPTESPYMRSMCTAIVKIFPSVPAVRRQVDQDVHNPIGVSTQSCVDMIASDMNMIEFAKTYAESMPQWLAAVFFDPDMRRHRLETHKYAESDNVRKMRCMEDVHLLYFAEMRLKSKADFAAAIDRAPENEDLQEYCSRYVVLQPGDYPAQFFSRQVVYERLSTATPPQDTSSNHTYSTLNKKKNPSTSIIPLLGPLHISLNAREEIVIINHPRFAALNRYIFKKPLAAKRKLWRISLLLELIYGGWTVIRESTMDKFSKCKDVQYGTLLTLLDSWIPLTLSIYSITFNLNNGVQYVAAMMRIWLVFLLYRRRRYNKGPFIWLSNMAHWRSNIFPLFGRLMGNIVATDELLSSRKYTLYFWSSHELCRHY